MSPSTRSTPTAPSLTGVADLLHLDSAGTDAALIVNVQPDDGSAVVGTWRVPPGVPHPADVLVGYLAPPSWHAVGLVSPARAWSLDAPADAAPDAVRLTYLADRSGAVASLLDDAGGGAPRQLAQTPTGWVPDVLARVLGLATPPPTTSPAACVEAAWLDRVAQLVLRRPGEVRTWEPLGARHPLAADDGPALPGPLLALRCEELDATSSWAKLRRAWSGRPDVPRPPGGVLVRPARWFDDGSFSRWAQRDLVPAAVLLPAVLDALPDDLGRQLVEALVTVEDGADRR